jgi:hypothetical protein
MSLDPTNENEHQENPDNSAGSRPTRSADSKSRWLTVGGFFPAQNTIEIFLLKF